MLDIVQPAWVKERLKNGLLSSLAQGLSVRPGEGRRTTLLFFQLLLSSAVFVMGRTVRDTLFLSRYSIKALPWMFIAYGLASAITVVVYGRIADKLARDRAIVGWSAVGVVSYLATWASVRAEAAWVYPVFYVWSEVFANLLISQFWTLANELFDARAAKRLFGVIGSARVLGVIVVGLGTGSIVHLMGTPQLLFVLSGLLIVIAALATSTAKANGPAGVVAKGRVRKHAKKKPRRVTEDRYVWALSAMLLCAFSALTVGDYQFKAIARATYKEDALAQFFSFFYAATGTVSFFFQMFLTPRILSRFGVGVGLSVMPSVFGAASAALLGVPSSLPIATVMKFADNGFQYTIHDTTMQALYVPFAPDVKVRARAFLDAVVKPLSYALGGAFLLVFAERLGRDSISLISVCLVAVWLLVVPTVRRRYMEKLALTLRVVGFASDSREAFADAGRKRILLEALSSPDARVVLAALDELDRNVTPETHDAMLRLAEHPDPAVRVAAIERFSELPARDRKDTELKIIAQAIDDPVQEVRAAAIEAYAERRLDESVDAIVPRLDDPSPIVRSAALSSLLRHAGFEGAMVAGTRLKELLASEHVAERETAAYALAAIGPSAVRRLLTLLEDEHPEVRLSAVRAAAIVRDPRLTEALLRRLCDPRTDGAAATALAEQGEVCVERLSTMLCDPSASRRARLLIPRILRNIACHASYRALLRATMDDDGHVRLRVFSGLSRLREKLNQKSEPLDRVREFVEREIRQTLSLEASYARSRKELATPLLDDAVALSTERGRKRVLRILELRVDPEPLRLVREHIEHPARRNNALEMLDSALEPSLRSLVMPFFDDVSAEDKARRYGVTTLSDMRELVSRRLSSLNPYTALVALDAVATHNHMFAIDAVVRLTRHADPMVREGALCALVALDRERARSHAKDLSHDEDAQVARVAKRILAELGLVSTLEEAVYSTVEKLLMLRAAPMFAKLRGEDLAPLARVAQVEVFDPGEVVFEAGDAGDALYIVARGKIAITHGGSTLATLGKGEAFGEMSVLDAEPRSATAVATEPTELLRIGSEEFHEVMREQVEIAEGVIRVLSQRLREANKSRDQTT